MLMYGHDGVAISFHMGIFFLGTGWTGVELGCRYVHKISVPEYIKFIVYKLIFYSETSVSGFIVSFVFKYIDFCVSSPSILSRNVEYCVDIYHHILTHYFSPSALAVLGRHIFCLAMHVRIWMSLLISLYISPLAS